MKFENTTFKWRTRLTVSHIKVALQSRSNRLVFEIYLSIYLSIRLSISVSLPTYLSVCLSICLSIYLSVYLSICLSVCLSVYLSIYLSLYLSISIDLSIYLFILYDVYSFSGGGVKNMLLWVCKYSSHKLIWIWRILYVYVYFCIYLQLIVFFM